MSPPSTWPPPDCPPAVRLYPRTTALFTQTTQHMSSDYQTTRRGFLASGATMASIFEIDEDNDGDILDDILGLNDDGGTDDVYVILVTDEDQEGFDEPAHERIAPAETPAILVEPDGTRYRWDKSEEAWAIYPASGENPTLQSLTVDNDARVKGDVDIDGTATAGAVQTTDATTKRSQSLALSDYFPQTVRRREQPGPPLYKPHPNADNPVLDEADIDAVESFDTTDVADPFMCFDADTGDYVIFFEIVTASSGIKTGYATSTDGLSYSYQGTLSNIGSAYPMPFKWDGTWYMSLPGANLYTADSFPGSWSQVENVASKLNTGSSIKDWTPFYWNGRWWSLAGRDTNSDGDTDEIAWHYSGQTETGPDGLSWTEPSWSPITTDAGAGTKRESPAGRPITYGNVVDYFGQHEGVSGQTTVSCYRISELTTNSFTESEVATSPVTRPWDRTFNSSHHIDPVMGGPGGPDVAISDIGTPWELWMLTTADDYHQSIRAAKSNSQDVSDGAWVGVDFDTVNRDWFDDYNTTATPTEYVVPNSGLYRVYVQVGWNTSVDGAWFKLRLRKNGSSTLARRDVTAGQVRQHFPNLEYEDEFVAGDTITVESQIDNVSSGTYTIQGFKSWTYLLIERKR